MNKKGRTLDVLAATPIIMAGHHEPLIFRRRAGYATADEEARFAHEHSPEVAQGLARRGVTWVRAHFFKGFGLAAEAEEIEIAAREIELLHSHGIKVELYTQLGTLQYETFLAEEPGCLDWCAVGPDGQLHTITYGHHDFRAQPCMNRDGYWTYFKKVLQRGIDIGADGFGFDNVCNTHIPDVCHCPQCRAAFVAYLKDRYRPDTADGARLAKERFGFAVLDHIRPPTFNRFSPARAYKIIINPVFQEWTDFRTDALARRFQEVWRYVKDRRPDIMLEYNVYPPMSNNSAWHDGIDMHKLLPWMDVSWNERPPAACGLRKDGCFWHRVHAYKLAEAYGSLICTSHAAGAAGQLSLEAGESLAFNGGHIAGCGYISSFAAGAGAELDISIKFRKAHPELYEKTLSAAPVGLVESALSLARNCVEPHYTELLAMSSLLAGQAPFDIVPELTADAIAGYDALVLPDTEILTDAQATLLLDYVRKGGGLVFTGRTGLYDAWRRRRSEPALAAMLKSVKGHEKVDFGLDARENTNVAQSVKAGTSLQGNYGKGRFVYISRLAPAKPYDYADDRVGNDLWRLPKNFKQFIAAVRFAQGKQRIQVTAPQCLAVEIRTAPDGRTLLHLLNYKVGKTASPVRLALNGLKASRAQVHVPGLANPRSLKLTRTTGGASMQVGPVQCYAVVELT